jgi:Tfp pilus assembly protein PilF
MAKNSNKNRSLLICLALMVVTIAVYCQVYSFEFIDYDDPDYVYENPNIQAGLTLKAVEWAFTAGYAANWHPLTWLSHTLDWRLFGSNPAGHHITNLIFHIANTLLLFIVLSQMTGALWPSAFVAALFALHPLHVESVAWIAERKDVLSTFFWMLTMWAYLQYVKRPKISRYLLITIFFALGLMTKPMLVTLPFVLLLLDYWPLNRISCIDWRILYRLILEKIPFIVLSAVLSVVAFLAQQRSGAMPLLAVIPLKFRICNAFISYTKYIDKMVWPARLALFYPHPGRNVSFLHAAISAVLLLAVTIVVLRFAKNRRYLFTGWFWYLGTLVPAIGLVQVGDQAMADRYSYITLTGLFIIIAWGAADLLGKWRYRKITLWLSALLVLSVLTIVTHLQVRHWKDTVAISQRSLKVAGDSFRIHVAIAEAFRKQGRFEEAIRHNREALRIIPQNVTVLNNLGIVLSRTGRIDEAVGCYKKAIEADPCDSEAWLNLGYILIDKGEFTEAVSLCRKALKIKPDLNEIRLFLGTTLADRGEFAQAVKEYEDFLRLYPQNAVGHNDFAVILFRQGEFDQAIEHFNLAIQIDPDYTLAKNNLNSALIGKQKSLSKDAENAKK